LRSVLFGLIIGEHISVKLVIASGVIERIFGVIGGSEFLLSAQGDGKRNNTIANVSIRGVEDLVVVRLEDAFVPLSVKISSINVGEEVSTEFLERRYPELRINSWRSFNWHQIDSVTSCFELVGVFKQAAISVTTWVKKGKFPKWYFIMQWSILLYLVVLEGYP